jgi:hypothetical protein
MSQNRNFWRAPASVPLLVAFITVLGSVLTTLIQKLL